MPRSYRIFIDDTSDIGNKTTNDPQIRYGSISAVFLEGDYRERFDAAFYELVEKHFGVEEDGRPPCLHRRQMVKPDPEGKFASLLDEGAREAWNQDCTRMLKRASYQVITISLDKVAFYYHHPSFRGNIYDLLVEMAVERFSLFLHYNDGIGDVMAESADPGTDRKLKLAFRRFMENGNGHHSVEALAKRFSSTELKIEPKSSKVPGLQLTDLIAKPAFAHCLEVFRQDDSQQTPFSRHVASILEESKFYRNSKNGNIDGYGRVWRPQKR